MCLSAMGDDAGADAEVGCVKGEDALDEWEHER